MSLTVNRLDFCASERKICMTINVCKGKDSNKEFDSQNIIYLLDRFLYTYITL